MTTDVLAERDRIQAKVEGRTLVDALADTVAEYADQPGLLRQAAPRRGRVVAHADLAGDPEQALDVAAALIEIGVAAGDTVAIMATNRIEHFLADIAAVHAAATPMSIYNTLSPEQVAFVAGHAHPRVVVLEDADHLARWSRAIEERDDIARVVVIDADAVPAGDLYSSGTTWSPRAVPTARSTVPRSTLGRRS